jgi:hypothetical protein
MAFTSSPVPSTNASGPPGLMSGTIPGNTGLILASSSSASTHAIEVQSSPAGGRWANQATVAGASANWGASLIHFGSQDLLAWSGEALLPTGGAGRLFVSSSETFGATWGAGIEIGNATFNGSSLWRPMLATTVVGKQETLVASWTDAQNHPNVMYSTDGRTWNGLAISPLTAKFPPCVASFLGKNWMVWTDPTGALQLLSFTTAASTNAAGVTTITTTWGAKPLPIGFGTIAGPTCFGGGNFLRIAWAGNDANHTINCIDTTNGETFTNHQTLAGTSNFCPTLSQGFPAAGPNAVALAWTGTDGVVNVGTFAG